MNSYTQSLTKRLFDLTFALPGLIVLSPLFILITLLIFMDDKGPVIFAQQRAGKNGKLFLMYKFRTMIAGAESFGRQLTVGEDKRITRTGSLLRKTKLDELPQLINVVLGNMSLVGPRPEVPKYVALYTPEQREVLKLTPGITDPASIKYRNESDILSNSSNPEQTYIEQIMPDKIRHNLEYAAHASLITDFTLILKTIARLAFS
ncbi:MAG TPA: sugar transferase [Armatimonadota bacterium]|nr:sugar transferase [Armatimonadota bacterium]HPP74193.1 sugar transferase [Armatimonadota bacterium]